MTWKTDAAEYAELLAPKEACGLVSLIEGKETFSPCKNLSEEPDEYFILDPDDWVKCEDKGEITGIFHSHGYGSAKPSQADKASCEYLNYPFYIYGIAKKDWSKTIPSGYKSGLYGRTWVWGSQDCWSLVTDYFLENLNIKLKYWPRPKTLKEFATNPYFEKVLTGSGFKEVSKDDIKENDVLLMEGSDNKLNHVAVYIGDQTILHHNIRLLSCREIYDLKYIQATKKVYRYAA